MKRSRYIAKTLALCASFILLCAMPSVAQSPAPAADGHATADGTHDFDFHFGTFTTHISRLVHPLTGSTTWMQLTGTVVTRPFLDGRGNFEELEGGNDTYHFKGITICLYNPATHQWSQAFVNGSDGVVTPALFGEFKNGRGEFYDQEDFNGRMIFVRFVWSEITPDSHHVEQAFSDDGGKTWETNLVANLTRVKP